MNAYLRARIGHTFALLSYLGIPLGGVYLAGSFCLSRWGIWAIVPCILSIVPSMPLTIIVMGWCADWGEGKSIRTILTEEFGRIKNQLRSF